MLDLSENINVELEQLSKEIGEILTGSQITRYFQVASLNDVLGVNNTKYKRIFNAFAYELNTYRNDSKILLL